MKKLGFGCMRLPMIEKEVDIEQTCRRQLNFISAQTMDTVLDAALNRSAELNPIILADIPSDVKSKPRKPELRQ